MAASDRCFNWRRTNFFFNMPVGAWIWGSYMWQPPNFSFPIRLCYERISVAKKSWENCLHVLSFPNSELLHFESGPSPSSDWQSLWQSFLQSGPSASSYETSFRTQHWCVQKLLALVLLQSRLISIVVQPKTEFEARRWHNSWVWVWYFQVCKFQICLLANTWSRQIIAAAHT